MILWGEEEDYKVRHIPENFGNGVDFLGLHFEIRFLAEGIIFGLLLFLLSFSLLSSIFVAKKGTSLGLSLVFSGLSFFFGVRGINDEPITVFLSHVRTFRRNRRTAYYNPRIKLEARSITKEKKTKKQEELPREKILGAFEKYKRIFDRKQQERAKAFEEQNAFDASNMFFEDDIGVIQKPDSYMTEEEVEKLEKKKKKMKDWSTYQKGGES